VFAFPIDSLVLPPLMLADRALLEVPTRLRLEPVVVLRRVRTVSYSITIVLMELSVCSSISQFLRMSTILVNCSERVMKMCIIRYHSVTSSGVPSSF